MKHRFGLFSGVIVGALCVSGTAWGQAAAETTTPTVPPAPISTSGPPGAAAAPAPAAVAVPPGYKLVKVDEPEAATRYDVQYPQRRGALPPGMELPYEDGDPIPPGYKLRTQKRRGLIIAGSIVTGVPWVISLTSAVAADYDHKSGFLLVPALGPWLMLAAGGASDEHCSSDLCDGSRSGLRATLVLDGIVQTAGAAMFAAGFLLPRQRLVRQDVTIGFVPTTLAPGAYGLGAIGTF
jgi:hypothetical protein